MFKQPHVRTTLISMMQTHMHPSMTNLGHVWANAVYLFLCENTRMENINTDVPLAELENVVAELTTFRAWLIEKQPQRKSLLAKVDEALEVFNLKLIRAKVTGTVG